LAKAGPRKIANYGDRFKATAVKLSSLPGVQVEDVAVAQAGKGESDRARASKLDVETTAELRRFRKLERRYKVLKRAQIQHWFIGAFGAVVLGVGIYLVHRQVERRIDQIGKL
jgi:hypothetical protein